MDYLIEITQKERMLYGENLILLEGSIREFLSCMDMIRKYQKETSGWDPVASCSARIKKADSMTEKLKRNGLVPTSYNAIHEVYDAAGVRLICPLIEDVYLIVSLIRQIPGITIRKEKDYISHPKPNGYRSYHMILQFPLRFLPAGFACDVPWLEIQLRTIAMDCWASIEHQLKYKKDISNSELMQQELKRCSDEIASTDLSLSTLRELIAASEQGKEKEV